MPTSQQSQDLAQRFIQALHQLEDQGDAALDGLLGLFADDACLRNPILQREHQERRGRNDIANFWRQYRGSFGDIHSEFSEVTANDHAAGLFWRSRGTDSSGKPVEYDGVTLLRLGEDGRIADFQGYFDSRDVVVGARS
ncbi:nuclear transport factor 2 family protein [Azohydromonas caseinilytica]|uniref:Nuclear transport factor 2 family protein n=1 Tax=Azohydromonas caseinilytica TaxID=2728836 RepID=A0A848F2B8_9BURK|nr:nuclear transport factor 2 family protein [Azohydromonas caseinilytica]NML13824.1 nuclear transport factor 2 family protein [Azohydromonas caseinilytica]